MGRTVRTVHITIVVDNTETGRPAIATAHLLIDERNNIWPEVIGRSARLAAEQALNGGKYMPTPAREGGR